MKTLLFLCLLVLCFASGIGTQNAKPASGLDQSAVAQKLSSSPPDSGCPTELTPEEGGKDVESSGWQAAQKPEATPGKMISSTDEAVQG